MFKTAFFVGMLALAGTSVSAHEASIFLDGDNVDLSVVQACRARQSDLRLSEQASDLTIRVIVTCPEADRLRHKAIAMVKKYYRLHGVRNGTLASGIGEIYAPTIDRAGRSVDRDDHLADLAIYDERYASLDFDVFGDSIDLRECRSAGSCIVHGTVEATSQRADSDEITHNSAEFALVLDLRRRLVKGECSLTISATHRGRGCDAYPFD